MRLSELLPPERVAIYQPTNGARPLDKAGVLKALAQMLSQGTPADGATVEKVLAEREQLQSTGIGEGVAIPHGALPHLDSQHAGLLIVPQGVDFAAIDGQAVNIVFAVISPKRATGEHLKTLARVSRILRNKAFRDRLVASLDSQAAHHLVVAEDGDRA
jgi:PTS system nitrogen regulatory IIA component